MNKDQAAKAKAEWLSGCLKTGWDKDQLDDLNAIWDRFKDEYGNMRKEPLPDPKQSAAPTSADKGLREAIGSVLNISEAQGRKGCTYGDTDYDSESAAYGYNTCLEYIKSDLRKALSTPPGGERREEIENACIDSLLKEFNRQGFDTSNWDGDEGWEKAIVDGVSSLTGQGEWVSEQEDYAVWLLDQVKDLEKVEGEAVRVREMNRGSIAINFKGGNAYIISINKASRATMD